MLHHPWMIVNIMFTTCHEWPQPGSWIFIYNQIHRTFSTYTRHLLNPIPGLDIPKTLRILARVFALFGRLCFTPFRLKIIPSDGAPPTLPYCLQPSHKRNILQRQNKPFVEFYSRQLGLSWDRPNAIWMPPLPQGGRHGSKTYLNDRGDPSRELSNGDLPPKTLRVAPDR